MISRAREEDVDGLRRLATGYWRPLYLYLRKRGESHEDASDSVQGFFEHVLSSGFLTHVVREGGKFRSYLLNSLELWRSRKRIRDGAQKRGGGTVHVPLESIDAFREVAEQGDDVSAEVAFDRQWAMEIVACAVAGLREKYEKRGREKWFDSLRAALPGGGQLPPYVELARQFETSEGAVKKAVFDLRGAFSERVREEIRATVQTNRDAEEELRYLVSVIEG